MVLHKRAKFQVQDKMQLGKMKKGKYIKPMQKNTYKKNMNSSLEDMNHIRKH